MEYYAEKIKITLPPFQILSKSQQYKRRDLFNFTVARFSLAPVKQIVGSHLFLRTRHLKRISLYTYLDIWETEVS